MPLLLTLTCEVEVWAILRNIVEESACPTESFCPLTGERCRILRSILLQQSWRSHRAPCQHSALFEKMPRTCPTIGLHEFHLCVVRALRPGIRVPKNAVAESRFSLSSLDTKHRKSSTWATNCHSLRLVLIHTLRSCKCTETDIPHRVANHPLPYQWDLTEAVHGLVQARDQARFLPGVLIWRLHVDILVDTPRRGTPW